MTTVGIRELRQQASDLVRRVEAGEHVTISVGGRATARLVPAADRTWRTWDDVSDLFAGPSDGAWVRDRQLVDDDVTDPWPAP